MIVRAGVWVNFRKPPDEIGRVGICENACCDIQIRLDLKIIIAREKFLDNKNNKAQLVLLLAETFSRNGIGVQQCSDDADTSHHPRSSR